MCQAGSSYVTLLYRNAGSVLILNCKTVRQALYVLQCTTRMRILSAWSEWAFITPRPLENKLELPFDDDDDEDGDKEIDDSDERNYDDDWLI